MKVFNEKKNRYFMVTRELINEAVRCGGISKYEIEEKISSNGFRDYNWDFSQALVGERNVRFEDIKLFVSRNGKYLPILDRPVQTKMTAIELDWLTYMIKNENIDLFLSEATIAKLQHKFEDRHTLFDRQLNNRKKRDRPAGYDENTRKNIRLILEAINSGKLIICKNVTLYGKVYDNCRIIPYKIEYSLRMDGFWLIGYSADSNKMIKMAVERMSIYDLSENNESIDFDGEIALKRKTEPLRIEIIDEKGVLERALHSFSGYRKEGIFDRERNVHRLSIYYYEFDEYELVRDIIALGCYVRVISPLSIREQIFQKVKSQISLFA